METYIIDGEQVTIDEDKKKDLNLFANRVYSRMGYAAKADYDFSTATHGQEKMAWAIAVEAYFLQMNIGVFD